MDVLSFGNDFKSLVRILYSNISRCTINNGYASTWFKLERGVKQGCPLSELLFVLAVEKLSACTCKRSCKEIKGIQVANREIKLSQYADDTTTFCKDELSLGKRLDLLDIFGDCSGLKLNTAKIEALRLGKKCSQEGYSFWN